MNPTYGKTLVVEYIITPCTVGDKKTKRCFKKVKEEQDKYGVHNDGDLDTKLPPPCDMHSATYIHGDALVATIVGGSIQVQTVQQQ